MGVLRAIGHCIGWLVGRLKDYGHVSGPMAIFSLVAFGVIFYFFNPPNSGSFDKAPFSIPRQPAGCQHAKVNKGVKVSPASGSGAIMNIYIGIDGNRAYGESPALSIQKGPLCPGSVWIMRKSQFIRPDGHTLQQDQVASWAQVDNNGTQLTVWVLAAPHHGQLPSGPGLYSGSVSLDSTTVQGAQVPVRIHVAYQNIYLIFAYGFLAAFGGFIWATLLHNATTDRQNTGFLFRNLTLCIAVLLAAAIPVVNVQVLSKPDWQGTLSQFIGLGTLIGAAAIASTPTLRALVLSRNVTQSPGAQTRQARHAQQQAPQQGQAGQAGHADQAGEQDPHAQPDPNAEQNPAVQAGQPGQADQQGQAGQGQADQQGQAGQGQADQQGQAGQGQADQQGQAGQGQADQQGQQGQVGAGHGAAEA